MHSIGENQNLFMTVYSFLKIFLLSRILWYACEPFPTNKIVVLSVADSILWRARVTDVCHIIVFIKNKICVQWISTPKTIDCTCVVVQFLKIQ